MEKRKKCKFVLFMFVKAVGTVADKDSILADKLNVLPFYYDIVAPAEEPEKFLSAKDDDRNDPCVFGIYFYIVDISDTAAVCTVYHLFVTKIRNTAAFHKISPPKSYSYRI